MSPEPTNAATQLAQRYALRTPREIMAYHAKTFYWASRLMPRQTRADIESLYAVCRFVDDTADETGEPGATRTALARLRTDLEEGQSDLRHVAAFLELARRRSIDVRCAIELVRGAASDLGRVRVADEGELLRYCYRVASTVGLMVCGVVDVRDPRALAYAIDLGIAMQLTNIARDVVEDYRRDRVYLPATWIDPGIVGCAIVNGDPVARDAALAAVYRLLDLAYRYYRSGDHGMCFLPWWARWAVLTSSQSYEAIGKVARARGVHYWSGRAFTRKRRTLWYTVKAASTITLQPFMRDAARAPRHNPELHISLRGLPHADVSCAAEPVPPTADPVSASPALVGRE